MTFLPHFRTDRVTPVLVAALLLAGLFVPRPAAAQSTADGPEHLQVLFLGDDGHHQPEARARQLTPYLASQGIQVTYTEEPDDLDPDVLARYDVVMMYGNIPEITVGQERALLDFVAEGGGFVPVHAASAMFGNSDAFINLVGGVFESHGTGTFTTRRVASDHPAIRGVPAFESWDETYVHAQHNPDKTVLAVREEGGREEPWTWVRTHGDGRVFYTAWGHDERTWSNPGFQQLLERAVRWSAGDEFVAARLAPPDKRYVAGRMPFYPAGVGWGVTGDPITQVQEPLRPAESLAQTFVEPGFRVELFAADPDVVNPIDMTWDEAGRLWIVETLDYPNEFEPDRQGDDRVKILEDTDGDGRADEVTVFADGLNIPTSLALAEGGVVVAQAPDMLFLKDTDGDDRADVKDVLFTGWGTFDTHAGPSNLRYGPDNWIWGVLGYSGFEGVVGGDSAEFTQGIYRFRPDGSEIEYLATTNNNTWGLGFSEEGLVFASTANNNPSVYLGMPHRYYDAVRGWERKTLPPIADDPSFYPVTDEVHQVDWHGKYTAGSGHELYTARDFPERFWNRTAFVGGPTGHLLGKFVLEPEGSGFRANNEWNIVASRDAWFAPIQAKVGPDGALWVIDWYNPIIQHNPTPEGWETGEGNAYETELRDRQHARIYRIVYEGADADEMPDLAGATPRELVAALGHDNMHWRLTAQRLLVERGERDVLPALYELIRSEHTDALGLAPGAIHALWTLDGLGAFERAEARAVAEDALYHPSAGVRRAAVTVLPRDAQGLSALLDAGLLSAPALAGRTGLHGRSDAVNAADARVRLAALQAVAEMPRSERAADAVAALVTTPGFEDDGWIRDAATAAAARHDADFILGLLERDVEAPDSTFRAAVEGVVRTVAAHYAAGEPSAVLAVIEAVPGASPLVAGVLLDGLAEGWPEGAPPALDGVARERLRRVRSGLDAGLAARFDALLARWGGADVLSAR